jgi:hypothetical protein
MKYISKYSNDKAVTAAQYITELICENKAKIEKKDLHFKFWISKEWSKFYRDQIATANKLLKKYEPRAVINALKDVSSSKIYSLRAPHLTGIIDKHQKLLAAENKNFTLAVDRTKKKIFEQTNKMNKNILSKLKDIDNEY